jgi:hypothetical protein
MNLGEQMKNLILATLILLSSPAFATETVMEMYGYPFSIEKTEKCKELGYAGDVCWERVSLPAFALQSMCSEIKAIGPLTDDKIEKHRHEFKGTNEELESFVVRYRKFYSESSKICQIAWKALKREASKEEINYLTGIGIVKVYQK